MSIDAPARIATPLQTATSRRSGLPRRLHEPLPEPPLLFQRMSFDEYLRLPEKPKAEWLDGIAVIRMAPPVYSHARYNSRLFLILANSLPNLEVTAEAPIKLPGKVFVPDIIVIDPATSNDRWIEAPPIVVVEILSPSTREYDLTTKSDAYLKAGIRQYWTVDKDLGEIVIRENAGDHWDEVAQLDADHPEIAVKLGDDGAVTLNRDQLFG